METYGLKIKPEEPAPSLLRKFEPSGVAILTKCADCFQKAQQGRLTMGSPIVSRVKQFSSLRPRFIHTLQAEWISACWFALFLEYVLPSRARSPPSALAAQCVVWPLLSPVTHTSAPDFSLSTFPPPSFSFQMSRELDWPLLYF